MLPDALARAPGRGAWIGVSRAELEAALANGKLKAALSRAFKAGALTDPRRPAGPTEKRCARPCSTGWARNARRAPYLGLRSHRSEARAGEVRRCSTPPMRARTARKLDQAWRVGNDAEGSAAGLSTDRAALSVALGRDNVVHLALTDRRGGAGRGPAEALANFLGPPRGRWMAANPRGPARADEPNLKDC